MSSVTVDNIPRDRVLVNADHVSRVSSQDFPHQYYNEENSFDIENFKKNVQIKLIAGNDKKLEFDFIGLSEAFANTIRRIMIAEVPTMAIEYVRIYNNNGIIQDEVLAHRLGLIPIKADPRKFYYKRNNPEDTKNTLLFNFNVDCKVDSERHVDGEGVPIINGNVYSDSIRWQPVTDQESEHKDSPIGVVYKDILITKMVPDQIIHADLLCHKGQGQDHIKFSPVATAFYRLMPEIIIQQPIEGELAQKFQKCFPLGVIEIEEKKGVKKAVVANPRLDRVTREVLRHPEFQDSVKLTRIRNHIIFNVETVGNMTPSDVFEESLKILKNKAKRYLVKLDNLNQSESI